MGVAERIREVMEGANLTIDQFANVLDEKPQRVKDVLRGKQRAPEDMLVKVVERFGVDANWLLLGTIPAPAQLSSDEAALLDNYRHSPKAQQDILKATSAAFAQSRGMKKKAS